MGKAKFDQLIQKVNQLTKEIETKDQQILALEKAQHIGSRLDLVRQHGTIEDLIEEVAALKGDLAKKERENRLLRELYGKKVNQNIAILGITFRSAVEQKATAAVLLLICPKHHRSAAMIPWKPR